MSDHGYGGSHEAAHSSHAEETVRLSDLLALVERRFRLIVTTIAVVMLTTFVYVGMQTPTYQSSATLMLMDDPSSSGLLAELALVDSTPAAASEMALLGSRSMVEDTIEGPRTSSTEGKVFQPTEPDSVLVGEMRRLGLTTLVQPNDLTPFSTLWAKISGKKRKPHRLIVDAQGPAKPADLTVRFQDEGTVELERDDTGETVLVAYDPGEIIEAFGLDVRLEAIGAYAGRSYQVSRPSIEDAVERVLMGLSVHETGRNSGVIEVAVRDSDPNRAAELANALCQNYILRSIRLGRYRASQTVDFVTEQLEAQQDELRAAEEEVVALQIENPSTIDISSAAKSLIERIAELELARTQASLAQTALEEAGRLLDEGNYQAIARLNQELPDLESLVFIQEMGRLTSESLLLERRDSGAFRMLLEQEATKQRRIVSEIELEERALEEVLASFESSEEELDSGALMRLKNPDLIPQGYRDQLAQIDAQLAQLAGSAKQAHPEKKQLEQARRQVLEHIETMLRSSREGLAASRTDRQELIADYEASISELPVEERGKVDDAIAGLGVRIRENLENRRRSLQDEQSSLVEHIAALETELGQLPEQERRLADPIRRVEAYSEIVQFLLKSQQEAQLSQASTMPSAVLIDPAMPPRTRSSPRLILSLMVAGVLAAALGLVFAFALQGLQGCMYTTADLEEATALPVFGTIPDFRQGRLRIRGAGEGYLPMLHEPGGIIAESYRSIRANLKFALEGNKPLRTLAVTSCAPGEGKTTTNTDLAVAFALGGTRVLIVDADVRRPTVHGYFGLTQSPGFADTIVDGADWRALVNKTEVETLSVLTAGHYKGTPGEALSSDRVSELIDEFHQDYDLVVFDLPPAILVADVEVFAHKLDALVLLYRSGGVPREAFVSAVRRVRASGANLVGLILNAVRPSRTDSRSYHTYGYGTEQDEKRRKSKRVA